MKFIYRFKNELRGEMTEECFAIPNIGRAPLKDQARFSSGTTQYCGIKGAVIHMRAELIAVRSTFARVPTFHKRQARIAASDSGFSGKRKKERGSKWRFSERRAMDDALCAVSEPRRDARH
jgi:hypothetical protein